MSKGTKQIRMGRISRLIQSFEIRIETLKSLPFDEMIQARIWELENIVSEIKKEFDI